MAGTHRDAVHQELSAQGIDGGTEVVSAGFSGAARRDDHVCPLTGGRQRVVQGVQPGAEGITDPLRAARNTAQKGHNGSELWAKGVTHLSRDRKALRHHFGPGQYDGGSGTGADLRGVVPRRRGKGNVRGIKDRPGRYEYVPGPGFLPGGADVLA